MPVNAIMPLPAAACAGADVVDPTINPLLSMKPSQAFALPATAALLKDAIVDIS